MKHVVFTALVALTLPVAAQERPPAAQQKINLSRVGPQVGDRVPDFNLVDQTGRSRTLESMMGVNGAMLVFFRSADW